MNTLDKTYNPALFEKEVYQNALESFSPTGIGRAFVILMPPPNVTGRLHVGHALTYTLQDILVRYYRQSGFDTLWQPGIDHAGIATQMVVSKKLEADGVNVESLSREELVKAIWKWKEESGGEIFEQQKALGCSAPWHLSRFTMDEEFCKAVNEVFVTLYKGGLIFRSKRLVNWDTKFKTAISDLEIQTREEKGTLWYIKYKILESNEFVTVATTRPETMFGDMAIAVHPEDDRYRHIVGKMASIPYTDRIIPVISDEHADMTKGTGCVKITPAHDYDDFAVGKRHGLDMITVLDEEGHMMPEYVPEFLKGLYLKKARKILVEKFKEDDLLVKEEEILHFVPYGDRSGTVIEPRLTNQWFLNAKELSEDAIKVVENGEVKFYPEKWKNTYFDWMKNIEPWCISRQIVWGHRIPAWYGPNGEIFVERSEEEAIIEAEKFGIKKDRLRQETDVLDTWFSSALWPFVTLGWPKATKELEKYYPTSTLVTGFDIIFFWVARMIMMSLYFMKRIPFQDIYIHALVRDDKGQKMSKSKGNVIDPLEMMNEFGTDALRFTLASLSTPGRDIRLGKEQIKINRNFITKIWNAARFLQSKGIFDKGLSKLIITSKLGNWIVAKLKKIQAEINQNIRDYRFDYAAKNIQFFLREEFCDFFIEALKFQEDEDIKNIAGSVFAEFLKISNPFIPFVTDHLSKVLDICDVLVLRPDMDLGLLQISEKQEKEVDDFVELIHNIRSEKHINGVDSEKYLLLRSRLDNWEGELKRFIGIVR
ncbi:MAG: valine--tRNA ligase [Holosporales bacterium]|jgi:valyl-tRNA synthetase|nr:valine--tRNA ligase [Holosporales bacterium]